MFNNLISSYNGDNPMIDMLMQMPSSTFMSYFIIFSISCIFIGWLIMRADGSYGYSMPELNELNPFEIAALRDGRKGIIQTALFNLWKQKFLIISGKKNTVKIRKKIIPDKDPANKIEDVIYQFATNPRKPIEFFTNPSLRSNVDSHTKSINKTLENLRLKRTNFKLKQAWIICCSISFVVIGIAIIRLYSEMYAGRSIILMMLLTTIMATLIFKFLKPNRNTRLGQRYQNKLNKHFEWMKSKNNDEVDAAFRIAIFGVTVLANFELFENFSTIFAVIAGPGNESGNGCGGCGGNVSSGGCGGAGCGGCGGGG
ncbi:TIGR04222 domain-containing membrane protein [Candidatus Halobeggiatoa sp. HSG11]|nr:TIGR04222 domain-containing membrane protein [Candidatus Halobeggiatoa sp. HSG11]